MTCADLVDPILAIGRVIVLVLGMLSGTFTIFLGWRLYRDGVVSRAKGELTFKDLRIALTAAGPGVFLALFGAYLLWLIVSQPLELIDRTATPAPTKYSSAGAPRSEQYSNSFIVRVQASSPQPPSPRCVIHERTRRLMTGADARTPDQIFDALNIASGTLETRAATAADSEEARRLRQSVAVLRELASGVVR